MDFKLHQSDIYLFTTHITPELCSFFEDDYNFETVIRHFAHPQQLAIRNLNTLELKAKRIVTSLFTRFVINFVNSRSNKDRFLPLENVVFKYNSFGKPTVSQFHFNSSTSNDVISVVVRADAPIGIDLSHARQNIGSQYMDDFRGIFGDSEYEQLMRYNDQRRYLLFNQFWTLKEAFTKYLGYGLNIDLNKFEFCITGHEVGSEKDPASEVDNDSVETENNLDHKNSYSVSPNTTISKYTINWSSNIPISTETLKQTLKDPLLEHPLTCVSAVLLPQKENQLPVIVSIITPYTHNFTTANYNINFLSVLRETM